MMYELQFNGHLVRVNALTRSVHIRVDEDRRRFHSPRVWRLYHRDGQWYGRVDRYNAKGQQINDEAWMSQKLCDAIVAWLVLQGVEYPERPA